jgi:hypothetical protein
VPEDQPGAGSRAYRLDVLAFPLDAVPVALRATATPAAPHNVRTNRDLGRQLLYRSLRAAARS